MEASPLAEVAACRHLVVSLLCVRAAGRRCAFVSGIAGSLAQSSWTCGTREDHVAPGRRLALNGAVRPFPRDQMIMLDQLSAESDTELQSFGGAHASHARVMFSLTRPNQASWGEPAIF